jgi:hypothetical protein
VASCDGSEQESAQRHPAAKQDVQPTPQEVDSQAKEKWLALEAEDGKADCKAIKGS